MTALELLDRLLADIVDNGAYHALGSGIVPKLLDIRQALAPVEAPAEVWCPTCPEPAGHAGACWTQGELAEAYGS